MREIYKYLGKQVKKLREEAGLSQEELSKELGYRSRVTVSKIENGTYTVSVAVLKKVSDLFKVPVSELLGEEPVSKREKDLVSFLREDGTLMLHDIEKITDFVKFVKKEHKKDK